MANPIIHFELMVADPAATRAFYGRVFDWKFDETSFPGYTMINTGKEPGGGLMARPPGAPMSALNLYFAVADIDRTLELVAANGGTVLVPRTEIPGIGWFAMFQDPERIPVGVLQEKR